MWNPTTEARTLVAKFVDEVTELAKREALRQDLALPLRQLVDAGALRTEGQRQGTKYYAGEKIKKPRAPAGARRRRS